jgi:hypothetical protein
VVDQASERHLRFESSRLLEAETKKASLEKALRLARMKVQDAVKDGSRAPVAGGPGSARDRRHTLQLADGTIRQFPPAAAAAVAVAPTASAVRAGGSGETVATAGLFHAPVPASVVGTTFTPAGRRDAREVMLMGDGRPSTAVVDSESEEEGPSSGDLPRQQLEPAADAEFGVGAAGMDSTDTLTGLRRSLVERLTGPQPQSEGVSASAAHRERGAWHSAEASVDTTDEISNHPQLRESTEDQLRRVQAESAQLRASFEQEDSDTAASATTPHGGGGGTALEQLLGLRGGAGMTESTEDQLRRVAIEPAHLRAPSKSDDCIPEAASSHSSSDSPRQNITYYNAGQLASSTNSDLGFRMEAGQEEEAEGRGSLRGGDVAAASLESWSPEKYEATYEHLHYQQGGMDGDDVLIEQHTSFDEEGAEGHECGASVHGEAGGVSDGADEEGMEDHRRQMEAEIERRITELMRLEASLDRHAMGQAPR